MKEDQLTRMERIRLESFAQACNASGAGLRGNVPITKLFEIARAIEQFLLKADSDNQQ